MSRNPEVGDYLFVPKEGGMPSGQWCVMMEPRGRHISLFDQNLLVFDLQEPTYENARALADALNHYVEALRVTQLPPR